jgi:hypothetical protein
MLNVHHLTYERLGRELAGDLKIVCTPCHESEDLKRKQREATLRRFEAADRALETWFFNKYGKDSSYSGEADIKEFEEWYSRVRD